MTHSYNHLPITVSKSHELLGSPAVPVPEVPDDVIADFQEESDKITVAPSPEIEKGTEFAVAAIELARSALKNVQRPAA